MTGRLPALAVVLAVGFATAPQARSAAPQLPRDGWVSWTVATTDTAPLWCCWKNGRGEATAREPCRLDARTQGFGARGRHETTDAATIYVRTADGKIDRLRVLAASCPVETTTPVRALADVSADDSVRWLVAQARQHDRHAGKHEPIVEQVLAALALHRGAGAFRELASLARADERGPTRKWAVFWLAQAGQPGAEGVLAGALRTDPDGEVREHAVFALTLLPDERATRALIATAEDRSLPREQRKRAVFWLAQSESDSAQAYLDQVLARATR